MDLLDIESCLLCLDVKSKMVGRIQVNSEKWQTANIEILIKHHLCPTVSSEDGYFNLLKKK